jgi:Tol biopolymer transport system component
MAFAGDQDGGFSYYDIYRTFKPCDFRRLTTEPGRDVSPTWSPDGKLIAFVSDRRGDFGVYRMNAADGTDVRRLASGFDLANTRPDWSRDGGAIAFAARQANNVDILVMDPDGRGLNGATPDRLTTNPGDDVQPSWSPNRQRVAFVSDRDGDREIYVIDSNGSNERRLTTYAGRDERPAWSPDGTKIAFVRAPGGIDQLYVMNADGTSAMQIGTGSGSDPAWSPDGGSLAFTDQISGRTEIHVMNANGTGRRVYWNKVPTNEAEPAFRP